MSSSLDSFDRRLQSLQDIALPISNSTNRLQQTLKNVEQTVVLLDNVLQFYTVYDELSAYISAGPTGDMVLYLRQLEQLQGSLDYFKRIAVNQKMTQNEYEKVNGLLKYGQRKLMSECEVLLQKYSNAYQATDLDILLSGDNDDALYQPRYTMTESDKDTLSIVFKWFARQHFKYGPVNLYASTRGDMIKKSLETYRKRQLEYEKADTALLNTPTSTPSPKLRSEQRKTMTYDKRRINSLAYRKHKILSPSGSHTSSSSSPKLSRSCPVYYEAEESETIKKYELFATLITLTFMLFEREKEYINAIFSLDLTDEVFAGVSHNSLVYLQQLAQQLCNEMHDGPKTNLSISILHVLQQMLKQRLTFMKLFGATFNNRQTQVCNLSLIFEQSAVSSFGQIIEAVKVDPKQEYLLSFGGGVQQITYTTLSFIETICNRYLHIASIIADGLYSNSKTESSLVFKVNCEVQGIKDIDDFTSWIPDESNMNLSKYLVNLLKWLNTNLLAKSDCYQGQDRSIRSIFLLNNAHYILHTIKRGNILPILYLARNDIDIQYTHDIKNYKKEYSNCYVHFLNTLNTSLDWLKSENVPDTKLKDKDRDTIKEIFTNVNRDIDYLIEIHDSLVVHDIELRQALRIENKAYLLPIYTEFYQSFNRKDFTKNPSKYIKYSVELLSHYIDNFFEKCS